MKKLFLFAALCYSSLYSQKSYNVALYGHMDNYFGGYNDNDYSEVWGWTDTIKQREYAFIGTSSGTSIVDITEIPIKEVSFLVGPPSTYNYHEFRTYKNYLYIGSEGSVIEKNAGIQIVDLSSLPDTAVLKKIFVWVDTANGTLRNYYRAHTVSIDQNFLYVNGGDFGGTRIMDISDPLNPIQVGSYGKAGKPYVHDAIIIDDTLYAAAINSGRMDIVDFSEKGHYTQDSFNKVVSKTPTISEGRTHQAWISENRNYMFVATEVTGGHLHIYDISDKTNPIQIATWTSDESSSIHNVFVKGDFLYVAYYKDGFRVLDISNPSDPIEVAFYDTHENSSAELFKGAWGVYPYFPSGKIAVSDMNTGLYVFTVDFKYGGKVTGVVRDASTNTSIDSVEVTVLEMGKKYYTTKSFGRYTYGTAEGLHAVKFFKKGYIAKTETLMTKAGKIDTLDITLSLNSTTHVISHENLSATSFALSQNFPNPFNPTTSIRFSIKSQNHTSLRLYNVIGQEVAVLADQELAPGNYSINFNAKQLSSGVYFYRFISGNYSDIKKMTIVQ